MISASKQKSRIDLFILFFAFAEMLVGFTGVLMSDFSTVFYILTTLAGIFGIVAIGFCITHPENIKLYDVLGMSLLLAYGTGTLNSMVSLAMDNYDLLQGSSVSPYWLTRTLGFTTAAGGFLHFIGRLDPKDYLFPTIISIDAYTQRALMLVLTVALIVVVFIITGKLGFMANIAVTEGYAGISPSAAIILDLMAPAGALGLYLGRKTEQKNLKIIFTALALLILFVQFGLGRRIFVFSLMIYIMAGLLAKRPKRLINVKNIIFLSIIILVIQVATTAFYTMRVASYSFKASHKPPSVLQLIPEAISVYKDRDRLYLAEKIHENLSTRTFVLEYLATLAQRSSMIEPTYGLDLARAFIVATPSLLYPSKYKSDLFSPEENLLNIHFRLPVWDAANSVLTASVGDFGEVGFFILPVLICFIFSSLLRVANLFLPPIAGMIVSFFLCKIMLSVEEDVVAYFTAIRSTVIIFSICWLLFSSKLFNLKSIYNNESSTKLS